LQSTPLVDQSTSPRFERERQRDDRELVSYLRIEEREVEAGYRTET
jgi:hypothetical protein